MGLGVSLRLRDLAGPEELQRDEAGGGAHEELDLARARVRVRARAKVGVRVLALALALTLTRCAST